MTRPLITHLSEALDAELLRQGHPHDFLPDCERLSVATIRAISAWLSLPDQPSRYGPAAEGLRQGLWDAGE